ncbi:MAG: DNA methyltransferase [Ginsengibacter sp.]
MILNNIIFGSQSSELEEESVVSDHLTNYKLFNDGFDSPQLQQLKIFRRLSENIPFNNGSSFSGEVHFQNAYKTPVQRWFPYREGYSTNLVTSFIKELNISGVVFDPFSGTGTTLLAARRHNLQSFGIDVNPISVLVSKVENATYSAEDVLSFENELSNIENIVQSNNILHTLFPLADKVFNTEILQALLHLKAFIRSIKQEKIQNLFFVAWLSIIEEVSNIKKEGNGIKYRNRKRTANGYINLEKTSWEKQVFPLNKFDFVKSKLIFRLNAILEDITDNYGICKKEPIVFPGSCLDFDQFFSNQIQFTFFSPPYCNCFDYFEIHKVELWLGDFVKNKEDFRSLRSTGFRSNTNALNHKPINYLNPNLENLIALFQKEKLWSKRIPDVIRGYFDDMNTLLSKLYKQTTKGGYVGIVVGNSAYSGVIIPTDLLIAQLGKQIGFKSTNVIVTRHLTTSSQQKKELSILKNYLRESVVLFKK